MMEMMDMSCDVSWVGVLGTQGSVVVRFIGGDPQISIGYFVSKNQHIATWSPDVSISAAQRAVLPGAAFGSLGPCRGSCSKLSVLRNIQFGVQVCLDFAPLPDPIPLV